jgi:DNA-binding IclR family transcriptional regulator
VQSVERACRLLMLVATDASDGSGKDLAATAGLAVPTAHHLLATLVAEGLLARDDLGRYILGPSVDVLADAHHRSLAVPAYLSGPLHQLATATGETSYLATWRNGEIVVLGRVEGSRPVRVSVPTGGRYHDAHARAAGKALLAFLPRAERDAYLERHPLRPLTDSTIIERGLLDEELERIQAEGLAVDDQEFTTGVSCLAMPIVRPSSLYVYAMSLPTQRWAERRDELRQALTDTVRSVVTVLDRQEITR